MDQQVAAKTSCGVGKCDIPWSWQCSLRWSPRIHILFFLRCSRSTHHTCASHGGPGHTTWWSCIHSVRSLGLWHRNKEPEVRRKVPAPHCLHSHYDIYQLINRDSLWKLNHLRKQSVLCLLVAFLVWLFLFFWEVKLQPWSALGLVASFSPRPFSDGTGSLAALSFECSLLFLRHNYLWTSTPTQTGPGGSCSQGTPLVFGAGPTHGQCNTCLMSKWAPAHLSHLAESHLLRGLTSISTPGPFFFFW